MKHLPQRWLALLAFWLTDETFVVVIARYNEPDNSPYKHWFFLGSALFMYINWQVCTIIGVVAGSHIPDASRWGLDFAMDVTFIGMLIPLVRSRPVLVCVLVAAVTAVLAHSLPNQLGLMVAALLGVGVGVLADTLNTKPTITEAEGRQ
jgi:predicted branched-subunit amino acid permease